jgi:hypothetical protein
LYLQAPKEKNKRAVTGYTLYPASNFMILFQFISATKNYFLLLAAKLLAVQRVYPIR